MKFVYLFLFLLFYLFFTLRSLRLSLELKRSVKAKDPALNFAIACTGLSALLFLVKQFYPSIRPGLLALEPPLAVEVVGLALMTAGLAFSVVASLGLGKSWRIGVDPREKTDLVVSGPYRLSRNPYFLSYDLVLVGSSISSASLVVALVSAAAILLFHALILKEERHLEAVHGEGYLEYKRRVRRYL